MGFQVNILSFEFIITVGLIAIVYLYMHFSRLKKKTLLANDSFEHTSVDGESSEWRRNSRVLNPLDVKEFHAIEDKFSNISDVSQALRNAGLKSANLIFGIDFTVSNLHQGEKSFHGRCLHDRNSNGSNPYQQVIQILGQTLEPFDEDGEIPAFGFGDKTTKDHGVFPLDPSGPSQGFRGVLSSYNNILQYINLSGPTNFAPLIYRSLEIVRSTKKYHILVIVADGQLTSEQETQRAIVDASYWPLSIVMIGVGDGPWDLMEEFDNSMENRKFDNFQFVEFQAVVSRGHRNPHAAFALHALMEIPEQYISIRSLGLLHMSEE